MEIGCVIWKSRFTLHYGKTSGRNCSKIKIAWLTWEFLDWLDWNSQIQILYNLDKQVQWMFENTINYRGYLLPVSVYFSVLIYFLMTNQELVQWSRVGLKWLHGHKLVMWESAAVIMWMQGNTMHISTQRSSR